MSKTYSYYQLLSTGIRFANTTKISDTLTFTGQTINIPGSVNGRKAQTVQNTIALNVPINVLPEGCTDTCSALSATASIRVIISAPASLEANTKMLWADVKSIVDRAIIDSKILQGFKPSANTEFTAGA